jgi:hypothetical protein
MSTNLWTWTVGAALVAGSAASADIGFSIGGSGRGGSFGLSYNQPVYGGRPHYGHHHHRGYHHGHHHHRGGGWGLSVQSYQPPPRYYAPAYAYPTPRTVIVPAPTYIVPAPTYVVPGYAY